VCVCGVCVCVCSVCVCVCVCVRVCGVCVHAYMCVFMVYMTLISHCILHFYYFLGDKVYSINGHSVTRCSLDQVEQLLRTW